MKKIPVIPECYKDLPDSTLMNSRDVAEMFGCRQYAVTQEYQEGRIPEPDLRLGCGMRDNTIRRIFWKLGTIRGWGK